MKTQASIYMDFVKANEQAQRLEQIASEINRLSQSDMEQCFSQIRANWEGENASAYLQKGRTLQDKIEKTAKELRKTAETIRRIAKTTYDAERKALQIAMIRK